MLHYYSCSEGCVYSAVEVKTRMGSKGVKLEKVEPGASFCVSRHWTMRYMIEINKGEIQGRSR